MILKKKTCGKRKESRLPAGEYRLRHLEQQRLGAEQYTNELDYAEEDEGDDHDDGVTTQVKPSPSS